MRRILIPVLPFLWGAPGLRAQAPAGVESAPPPVPFIASSPPSAGCGLEWSQGEPFVPGGATLSTSHGFQSLGEDQPPTALLPPALGLSLIVLGRTPGGYRLRFDEAEDPYRVTLFGTGGRWLRSFAVNPGQDSLGLPYAQPPGYPVFLSVQDASGQPLQGFKLFPEADARRAGAL